MQNTKIRSKNTDPQLKIQKEIQQRIRLQKKIQKYDPKIEIQKLKIQKTSFKNKQDLKNQIQK